MKKFTVLLRYPDYLGNWPDELMCCHVEANDVKEALALAFVTVQATCLKNNITLNGSAEEDFAMVAIFEGHCKLLAEAATGI